MLWLGCSVDMVHWGWFIYFTLDKSEWIDTIIELSLHGKSMLLHLLRKLKSGWSEVNDVGFCLLSFRDHLLH